MSHDPKQYYELSELILESLEGRISEDRAVEFKRRLSQDPEALDYYSDYLRIYTSFRFPGKVQLFSKEEDDEGFFLDLEVWEALAEYEENAEAIVIEKPSKVDQPQSYTSSKLSIYLALSSVAGLILMIISVIINQHIIPSEATLTQVVPYVATLTQVVDPQWADGTGLLEQGTDLSSGPMELTRGIAEITFCDGSVVTLEGPSKFTLEAIDQIYLKSGKLWAQCEYETGFTVRSPSAVVVDYGTEFGVVVDLEGYTKAYVTKGEVDLRVGSDVKVYDRSQRLTAGKAASVEDESITILEVWNQPIVNSIEDLEHAQTMFGKNLIVNGDFEQDEGVVSSSQFHRNLQISGWKDDSPALVANYKLFGSRGFYVPDRDKMMLPPNKGNNFFNSWHNSTISQVIDVSTLFYYVDQRKVRYDLSGWLGGLAEQDNPMEIKLKFMDANGNLLGKSQIGPVKPIDRNNKTGFVKRQKTGMVPVNCRKILVELQGRQISVNDSDAADAYADNVSLSLAAK